MSTKKFIYPHNLRATANLWLWSLRDFTILCIAVHRGTFICGIAGGAWLYRSGGSHALLRLSHHPP